MIFQASCKTTFIFKMPGIGNEGEKKVKLKTHEIVGMVEKGDS